MILFSTIHANWPYKRQFISKDQAERFTINDDDPNNNEYEWLVVYDEPHTRFNTTVPFKQRILFIAEPPEVRDYPKKYLGQFGIIVTPYDLKPPKKCHQIIRHSSLPWHFGVSHTDRFGKSIDVSALKGLKVPEKQTRISVICSKKTITDKQVRRLEFIETLKKRLGDKVQLFGRGFQEVDDKAEGILPYKYHLVLENNDIDHFWTEKLADAFLGYSFPFYSGGDISNYFGPEVYQEIDINKPEEAIQLIEDALNKSLYDERIEYLKTARDKVISDYNLFNEIERIKANHNEYSLLDYPEQIKLSDDFGLIRKLRRKLLRLRSKIANQL